MMALSLFFFSDPFRALKPRKRAWMEHAADFCLALHGPFFFVVLPFMPFFRPGSALDFRVLAFEAPAFKAAVLLAFMAPTFEDTALLTFAVPTFKGSLLAAGFTAVFEAPTCAAVADLAFAVPIFEATLLAAGCLRQAAPEGGRS